MKIKVGIIGCGSIAKYRHIPEIASNPDAEVVAVCDIVKERAEKMGEEYGARVYTDYRELIALTELDAVCVCATNVLHAKMTIEALQAGKHVLCEKPMATTLEDARKMIEASEQSGKYLMIGHNQRLTPTHKKAREIIESGRLGRVLTFKTVFGHQGCDFWAADKLETWFFKKEHAGFGSSADLGIHKADLIRWLLGENIVEVSAFADVRGKRNSRGELISVDDNAVCLLRSESGVIGTLVSSWTYAREENSTVIYFEKGLMKIYDDPQYDLVIYLQDGTSESYKISAIQTNTNQSKSGVSDQFIESILNGRKPNISGEEGYEALKIILGCLQSSEEKRVIKIS